MFLGIGNHCEIRVHYNILVWLGEDDIHIINKTWNWYNMEVLILSFTCVWHMQHNTPRVMCCMCHLQIKLNINSTILYQYQALLIKCHLLQIVDSNFAIVSYPKNHNKSKCKTVPTGLIYPCNRILPESSSPWSSYNNTKWDQVEQLWLVCTYLLLSWWVL